ncbi:MAG: YceI family protein [bacterium]|nr:YceI family protein [bacterium]
MKKILFVVFVFSCYFVKGQVLFSEVTFEIRNAGLVVNGHFEEVKGVIKFDPNALQKSSIKATVGANDINTGIAARDKHLKKDTYFNVEKFPLILLESKFFGKTSDGFKGYFLLTMKGVSKDVIIPFTYVSGENHFYLKGSFELNRLDYGIGEKNMFMSNEVKINIFIKLEKK